MKSQTDLQPRIALASGSPRRANILRALGIPFSAFATDVDETLMAGEEGVVAAERLARVKAAAGAKVESLPVLAADTIVVLDGQIYGKPDSGAHARRMLGELQGHTHEVITGVCIHWGDVIRSGVERTAVTLAKMSVDERDWYVETGEPLDKAGAYNIEGLGAMFIAEVRGSPSNVAGLPVGLLRSLVREAGVDLGWPER